MTIAIYVGLSYTLAVATLLSNRGPLFEPAINVSTNTTGSTFMSSASRPDVDIEELQAFVADEYDLRGTLSPLPGERDQNIRLTTTEDEQFVLKVSHSDEMRSALDMQCSVLKHLEDCADADVFSASSPSLGQVLPLRRSLPTAKNGLFASFLICQDSHWQSAMSSSIKDAPDARHWYRQDGTSLCLRSLT